MTFQIFGSKSSQDYDVVVFVDKLDTMSGRTVDNANFFQANDLDKMTDEQLYNSLLTELTSWINEVKSKGILA